MSIPLASVPNPTAAYADDLPQPLAIWVKEWEADVRDGRATSSARSAERGAILGSAELPVEVAAELAATIGLAEGPLAAAPVYRAVVSAAADRLSSLRPRDPTGESTLASLRAIRLDVAEASDWPTFERLNALLADREPAGSPEAFRANLMYAEALYYQGHVQEATAILERLNDEFGEVLGGDKSARTELVWARGLMLYQQGDYAGAIPMLEETAGHKTFGHANEALATLIVALLRSDRREEAEHHYDAWVEAAMPTAPPDVVNALSSLLESPDEGVEPTEPAEGSDE